MFGGKIMDSFKDKIAEKFGTTDIIRANSEAEAKELNNAKARVEELEKAVSEMRRLSLKCAETNEMTTQMIRASIEKIEETQVNAPQAEAVDYTERLDAIEKQIQVLKDAMADSFKEQEEVIHKEDVRVYRNVQASIIDELKQQSEALAMQHMHIEKKFRGIKPMTIISLVFSGVSLVCMIAIVVLAILSMGL